MTPQARSSDDLARALSENDPHPLVSALAALGMPKPELRWNPAVEDLPDRRLRELMAYWRGLGGAPRIPDIDPTRMGEVVGYAMLLEALPDGDFLYRLYGSRIAERAGFDMTGKRASEINPANPAVALLYLTVYRAAALRRAPIYTHNVPPPEISVVSWSRLVLPMAGVDGRTDFLVGNIPGEPRPIA